MAFDKSLDGTTHLITIRPATRADFAAVVRLLQAADLPGDGLEDQFGDAYAVAESAGVTIGAAGVERHGDDGLLRSAVVDAAWRGKGVGEMLTRDRLQWARTQGLRDVWLLTTTAAEYFPRYGFVRAARDEASPALQASREFAEACPASAVAMRLHLS